MAAREDAGDLVTRLCVWLGMGAVMITGAVLRVSSLSPRGLLAPTTYDAAFGAHAAAMLAALPLLLFSFLPWRPTGAWVRPAAAGALLFGMLLTLVAIVLAARSDTGWTYYAPMSAAPPSPPPFQIVAAVSALFSLLAVVAIATATASGAARVFFVIAAAAQAAAWIGPIAGAPWLGPLAFDPTLLAVLAAPLFETRARRAFVVLAAAWLAAFVATAFAGHPLSTFFELLIGGALGLAAIVTATAPPGGWARRAEGLFFLQMLCVRALLAFVGADTHLHDTFAQVAAHHLGAFVLVFALLRQDPGSGTVGTIAAAAAAQAMCAGMLVLGARGMPRRYAMYLDSYQPLQIAVSVAAAATIAALAIALIVRRADAQRA